MKHQAKDCIQFPFIVPSSCIDHNYYHGQLRVHLKVLPPLKMNTHHSQHPAQRDFHCDVLMIGAGLAGLAASIGIQRAGHRVTIIERMPELREVANPPLK